MVENINVPEGISKQLWPFESKMGIENLKLVTRATARVATSVGNALEDGKLDLNDLWSEGPTLVTSLWSLKDADFSAIKDEVADFDDKEKRELADVFSIEFDIVNDSVEYIVEQGVAIVIDLLNAIKRIIEIGKLRKEVMEARKKAEAIGKIAKKYEGK